MPPCVVCTDLVERASALIGEFGLSPVKELARTAYGDQRKLEVALSMAGEPRLLLLDEPMAGLSRRETRCSNCS
jgi:branched-chain amino acid transport system ATP-binding protein